MTTDTDFSVLKGYGIAIGRSDVYLKMGVDGVIENADSKVKVNAIVQLNAYDLPNDVESVQDTFNGIPRLRINADDNEDYDMVQWFDYIYSFVVPYYCEDDDFNVVLFCCEAGASRAPTSACSFIMRKRKMSFPDAFSLLCDCRPCIEEYLNTGFSWQLEIYGEALKENCGDLD